MINRDFCKLKVLVVGSKMNPKFSLPPNPGNPFSLNWRTTAHLRAWDSFLFSKMGPWPFVPPWSMWFDNSMVSNEATMLEWSRETCMWIYTWSIKRKTYRVNIPYPKCLIPEALWISDLGYFHIHSTSQRWKPVMSKHKIHFYCMFVSDMWP